jgi:N-acylneuraminate cytidylyltransferase
MTNHLSRIAVIPARGGSKRIPGKNSKNFAGKPMIAYAISAALDSNLFSHVVVSTDDKNIASIALDFGAEVPFMRPSDLSGDETPTVPVVVHAIVELRKAGWNFDTVCCVYPCVPFLLPQDLMLSHDLFISSKRDFCFPVLEYQSPIQRALSLDADGDIAPFFPEAELIRTQDLQKSFHDAGQFYWGSTNAWETNTKIHSNATGFVMSSERAIDIDTPEDWARAELLAKVMNLK